MTNLLIKISNNLYESIIKGADLSNLGWIELYESVQHGKDTSTYEALNSEIERLTHDVLTILDKYKAESEKA